MEKSNLKTCITLVILITIILNLVILLSQNKSSNTQNLPLYTRTEYRKIDEKFGFIGRWYKQNVNGYDCMVTNNSGSELYFKTQNASYINVEFEQMVNSNSYFAYSIDNSDLIRQNTKNGIITLSNTNIHTIRVICDGISENIDKWNTGNGYALKDIVSDGIITGLLPNKPIIAFYGDSITEGIRSLGITPTNDMGDTNSATAAFPRFTCEALNAVSYSVGYGASGVTQNGSFSKGINAMKYLYNSKTAPKYNPDLIVLNYGTNDIGASSENFTKAYQECIDFLKQEYPLTKIVCMIPFGQHKADEIRNIVKINSEKCYLVETEGWDVELVDGAHLSKAGAQKAGLKLAEIISNLELIFR